jgi:hypothetical protein
METMPGRPPGSPQRASAWPIPEAAAAPSLELPSELLRIEAGAGAAALVGRSDYSILLVDDDPATLMAMKRHLLRMRGPVQYQGARRGRACGPAACAPSGCVL